MSIKHWRETRKPFNGHDDKLKHLLALADELNKIVTVFDLEGTSFVNTRIFGITEVGFLHVLPQSMAYEGIRTFTGGSLVNPENPIPRKVQKLTGIKPAMVDGLENFKTQWGEAFKLIFKEHFVLGFNSSSYDVKAILDQSRRYQCDIEQPEFHRDIKTFIYREQGVKKGKLTDFMVEFGINYQANAHRATDDAIMTAMVLNEAIERFGPEGLIQGVKKGLTKKRAIQTMADQVEAIRVHLEENPYVGVAALESALGISQDNIDKALTQGIFTGSIDVSLIDNEVIQDEIDAAMSEAEFDFDSAPRRQDGTLRLRELKAVTDNAGINVTYSDLKVFALNYHAKSKRPALTV